MFWFLLANALALPAWALVPLGVNLIRHARSAPTPGRRAAAVAAGLGLMAPAFACTLAFVLAWAWASHRGGAGTEGPFAK